MKLQTRKVIISCAVTGSVHTPPMSEHPQADPRQIIKHSIDAACGVAAILHLPGTNDLYIVTNDWDGGQGSQIFHAKAFGKALVMYSHQ